MHRFSPEREECFNRTIILFYIFIPLRIEKKGLRGFRKYLIRVWGDKGRSDDLRNARAQMFLEVVCLRGFLSRLMQQKPVACWFDDQ